MESIPPYADIEMLAKIAAWRKIENLSGNIREIVQANLDESEITATSISILCATLK